TSLALTGDAPVSLPLLSSLTALRSLSVTLSCADLPLLAAVSRCTSLKLELVWREDYTGPAVPSLLAALPSLGLFSFRSDSQIPREMGLFSPQVSLLSRLHSLFLSILPSVPLADLV